MHFAGRRFGTERHAHFQTEEVRVGGGRLVLAAGNDRLQSHLRLAHIAERLDGRCARLSPCFRRRVACRRFCGTAPVPCLHQTASFYVRDLHAGRSADQLIQGRYFDRNAPLRGEFHKLFGSLFGDYTKHLSVIEALSAAHYGLSSEQLLSKTRLHSGGGFSTVLSELLESGFITFLPQFGNKKKAGIYLLTDEFTLFYLKWVRRWENELTGLEGYW